MLKKVKIPNSLSILFVKTNNTNYLVGKNISYSYYLFLPSSISIVKEYDFLVLNSESDSLLSLFYLKLVVFFKRFFKPFKKTILLKGLGLKVTKLNAGLEFKLGFSHICLIKIPNSIFSVNINKNTVSVEGFDSVEIGNFLNRIRELRRPNIYKGKGIWYKNEVLTLKTIKKT